MFSGNDHSAGLPFDEARNGLEKAGCYSQKFTPHYGSEYIKGITTLW